jgi:hypothetical protein
VEIPVIFIKELDANLHFNDAGFMQIVLKRAIVPVFLFLPAG